ncbi:MAG: carboxypeptidase-like regulatory domain-containing protein, partial [Flavobacterium sp.]|nr:carboxypeptidase-like regulatory domain-containing protein [Flavobacterium sp.]
MTKKIFVSLSFFFLCINFLTAQTKVSGIVYDEFKQPLPYANVVFKGTTEGIITNEEGKFYLESKSTQSAIVVTFVGMEPKEVPIEKAVTYNMEINLGAGKMLNEVVIYTGKTSKKNNPAIDILRKIWARKKKNGLRQFKQYQYDKYEKVEFDLNTIDSALMKSKLFKGMEFVFEQVDTSDVTGKSYLPIFINEALSQVYGDNTNGKLKEITKANKNSGFSNNQQLIAFIKDLYAEYDIYDNYLKFFDKDFVSPLSRTGINVYNYVLHDSTYIDNKWCYNIVFYPRRKNELTFKGDFWVNDTTFAIKKINLTASRGANINWVKEIYIEQEFEVLNDSVFLLTRDHMMSDFAFSKKDKSRGVYGKRTTLFRNHKFDIKKEDKFYKEDVNFYDPEIYTKSDDFWNENRFESLNKDEKGVYKMLDTLKTVKKFKRLYNLVSILGSGYIEMDNFDYGPIFSTFGYNDVEGIRVRTGGRTYFGPNDPWRIQAYTAYGFKDNQFKYGISGKILLDKKNRFIISGGNRRDIEQIGVSLTTSNDLLGRSFASSSLFASGDNSKLTSVNLTNFSAEVEPLKNLVFQAGMSYRTLKSASPSTFSLDYYKVMPDLQNPQGVIENEVNQYEFNASIDYMPGRRPIGYGVERTNVDSNFARLYLSFSQGVKGVFGSDFDYEKLQFYYRQPLLVGGFGRLFTTLEAGKIFGTVPLGLMGVVPGNQSFFI